MVKGNFSKPAKDADYMLFLTAGEKLIYAANGVLEKTIEGSIVLTDKKIFFYFVSNISRDKVFIATHPYLKSVELKKGFASSTLVIGSHSKTFSIYKMKKNQAVELYDLLDKIIKQNK